jgi:hypothetical protein
MKDRIRAGLIHLASSATVALIVFLLIYFLWYPAPLFELAGGRTLLLIIAGVDVCLGPMCTLVVFKRGKKGLVFDLAVIVFVQLTALTYGVWVMFEARPVYIVFVKDRYELVRANGFPEGELAKAHAKGYDSLSWTGPRLVGAVIPKDPDEQFRVMMSGFGGVDLQYYPQHYVPYDQVRAAAKEKALPIATLRQRNPKRTAEIDAELRALGRKDDDVRFLPLRTDKNELAMLVDAKTAEPLRILAVNPWE